MRVATSIAITIACVLASAPARAQSNQAAATIQFDQGRALMKQRKYEEACEAFEKSQKLDPQLGTQFNLAECQAQIGKLATAWLTYRELGQRDTNAGRKKEAGRRAQALEKRLPKLLLKLASPPPGLAVTINANDSTALVGIESPVDLGEYKIRATAPGYATFETTKSVTVEGKTVSVTLKLVKGDEAVAGGEDGEEGEGEDHNSGSSGNSTKSEVRKRAEPSGPTSHRKRNGVIAGLAGGGVIAVGAVFGLRARSNWSDAEALCPDHDCATAADKEQGDALVSDARSNATISTVLVGGGLTLAVVGIYFAVTAKKPERATAVQIAPTNGGAAVVFGGRF